MDAGVPICKRAMGSNMLRAGIMFWNHKILNEYLPNTATKSNFSNISYKREKKKNLKNVTFVYSTLSGTLSCQADEPVTLFCLELFPAIATDSRIMQNTNI